MHYYEVAPNQIIRLGSDSFTYCSDKPLSIGKVVLIEIRNKNVLGVIVKETTKPVYETKYINEALDQPPLPKQLIKLALWISSYYSTPLANTLQTILPAGITKNRRSAVKEIKITKRLRTNIVFNDEQQYAIDTLNKASVGTFLLQGITGSGKTEIYIEITKQVISSGRSVVVLVPEIALTSQLIAEFSNHFDNILVTHSKMTESAKHSVWLKILNSDEPIIIIGPRSALFMPIKNIGAIIIDEAHEPSYKQEQAPKYSALRVATILGRLHNSKVILGSATPNIVDRYLAEQSDNPILKLTKVARNDSVAPTITLIDMTKRDNFIGHSFLSKQLLEQISRTLDNGKQVLIFHNRRGSTSNTICKNCGWSADCPNCFLPLTLHSDQHRLLCHICGHESKVPTHCPKCSDVNIIHKGIGTKLIESELKKIFPKAHIARFDADSKDDETVHNRYDDLYNGKIDIAIGTQVVAKGLDLPQLRTVGVIQADSGLSLPDFGANERVFQLLSQVIGRVGRNKHETNVIVQSYQPNHPSIVNGIKQDYETFYNRTIQDRKKGQFPPFTYLLKLTCVYKTEEAAIKNAKKIFKELRNKVNTSVQILGPTPAFYERQRDTYRWQLLLKSPKREYLIDAINFVPTNNWHSDLDPTSLL